MNPGEFERRWRSWVETEIGGPEGRIQAAMAAAAAALRSGANSEQTMAAARAAADRWRPTPVASTSGQGPHASARPGPSPGLSWHRDRMGRRIPWSVWRSTPIRIGRFLRAVFLILIGVVLLYVFVSGGSRLLNSVGSLVQQVISGGGTGQAKGNPPANDCAQGYTWRGVIPSDHVCVTTATAQQVVTDDSPAVQKVRTLPNGFCVQGYVWREAVPNDHVCVTPATRAQAAADNQADDHKAS